MRFLVVSACFLSVCAADIQFDIRLIPKVDSALPVFSLGSPAVIPQQLLSQFVNNTAPGAELRRGFGAQYAFDGNRLVALVNETTGETKIFPTLRNLRPAGYINTSLAFEYLRNEQIFPKDDTNFTVTNGSSLLGSTYKNGTKPTSPKAYLSHAWVQRNITVGEQHYPVCGPGGKASFGFAADGSVHSLTHLWKPARLTSRVVRSIPRDCVYHNIIKQLESIGDNGLIRVKSVEVCFYDSGANFLQPVYRFDAQFGPDVTNSTNATTAGIQGFIPLGNSALEPITDLTNREPRPAPAPAAPFPFPASPQSILSQERQFQPQIKVGRYIDRNVASVNPGYTQWYQNSWSFIDGLWESQIFPFGSNKVDFIDSQYLWAYPYQFTSDKESYVDSVHIADTEVHGNWHVFWTLYNTGDLVFLSDIPASGYGGGAGGSLAYWILHSCEVISTLIDYSAADSYEAWAVWWSIFNGLHAVVGYRTEMQIADGVTGPFGLYIGLGAAVVSSWLTIVHDTALYVPAILDNENPNGIYEPEGRAAAVAVCGHGDDIVTDIENLGRPDCLEMWWYDNSY